jgi:formamidopyrimidine-DNA glycosylase
VPELPEVEVVRAGLERWINRRVVAGAEVFHPRSVRRHQPGAADFVARLQDRVVLATCRRGKFLWLPLDSGDAVVAHLGMSGQLLMQPADAPDETHLRVRVRFRDSERELRFVDQRTFGGLAIEPLVEHEGAVLPRTVTHIARDPLDPEFDVDRTVAAIRARRTGVKRALLDQTVVSGIGNIYADEALWRSRLHYARPTETMTRSMVTQVLQHARDVMEEALEQGGTSFDSLYIDVNGRSGYFERSLDVYGREDLPCPRCGTPIRREPFMNRSSHRCPRCQRVPRAARW